MSFHAKAQSAKAAKTEGLLVATWCYLLATASKLWSGTRSLRLRLAFCFPRTYFLLLPGLLLAGCSQSPAFRLNTEGRDPQGITPAQTEGIEEELEELFGVPDEPRVPCVAIAHRLLPEKEFRRLHHNQPADRVAARGGRPSGRRCHWKSARAVPRHCVTCHGISGGGDGPTAAVLSPYPRNFRRGVFKYTSTAVGAKPARDDLRRTLRRGIPGAAMPSFSTLVDEEIESLVEYVQYLSIRGQTELYLTASVLDQHGPLQLDGGVVWKESVLPAARSWAEVEKLVVVPPAPPACDTPRRLAVSIAPAASCSPGRSRIASIATAGRAAATACVMEHCMTIGTCRSWRPHPSGALNWPGDSTCRSNGCGRGTSARAFSTAATARRISTGGLPWASRARQCQRRAPRRVARRCCCPRRSGTW